MVLRDQSGVTGGGLDPYNTVTAAIKCKRRGQAEEAKTKQEKEEQSVTNVKFHSTR